MVTTNEGGRRSKAGKEKEVIIWFVGNMGYKTPEGPCPYSKVSCCTCTLKF